MGCGSSHVKYPQAKYDSRAAAARETQAAHEARAKVQRAAARAVARKAAPAPVMSFAEQMQARAQQPTSQAVQLWQRSPRGGGALTAVALMRAGAVRNPKTPSRSPQDGPNAAAARYDETYDDVATRERTRHRQPDAKLIGATALNRFTEANASLNYLGRRSSTSSTGPSRRGRRPGDGQVGSRILYSGLREGTVARGAAQRVAEAHPAAVEVCSGTRVAAGPPESLVRARDRAPSCYE